MLHTSNRSIDSCGIVKRPEVFPKARSSDQSQPTSSEHANYYAARPEIGRCKYMSQKTIAFWAMLVCFLKLFSGFYLPNTTGYFSVQLDILFFSFLCAGRFIFYSM